MVRKIINLVLVALIIFPNISFASVTGIRSLNNEEVGVDYKVSDQTYQDIFDSVSVGSNSKEKIFERGSRDLSEVTITSPINNVVTDLISEQDFRPLTTPLTDKELVWLIENNIVSREGVLTVTPSGVSVKGRQILFDRSKPMEPMFRSEFLVGAYKAIYGVLESRPLLIKTSSVRYAEEQYKELVCVPSVTGELNCFEQTKYRPASVQIVSDGGTYRYVDSSGIERVTTFPEGDYFVYVSPNVTELYLKDLLDKKIIDKDELHLSFQRVYDSFGKFENGASVRSYPRWWNDFGPFAINSSAVNQNESVVKYIQGTNVFGDSYKITGSSNVDKGSAGSTVQIEKLQNHEYFVNESVDTITALQYIETMLRLTEKDMTDLEARIVSYKYGASYLDSLEEEARKTVMFLTAKGILNFEDPTEYRNLYGLLTKEFAYKLMYRLANKSARLDFSQIQLTDSDNFWISKGYRETKLTLNFMDEVKISKLKTQEGYRISPLPEVQTLYVRETSPSLAKANTEKRWFFGLFSTFNKVSTFAAPEKKQFIIAKVFDHYSKYKYRGIPIVDLESSSDTPEVVGINVLDDGKVEVFFEVEAVSSTVALQTVDSKIQIGTDSLFNSTGINAVSRIHSDGETRYLVPASTFKSGDYILVMEDKVLKNVETGAMAVLLQNADMALVGTHIINSEDVMVMALDGEVYYNLEVIRVLMSNSYISSLDPHSIYLSHDLNQERLAEVVSSTGNVIGKTYITQHEAPSEGGDALTSGGTVNAAFINISQLSTSSNFLIKTIETRDENNRPLKFRIVLHLVYHLPDQSLNFLNPIYDTDNPDFAQVNEFLYQRPEDPELRDWWDNNIELSNAFVNVFYGNRPNERQQYVRSGYLVPNITILYDQSSLEDRVLTRFFQEVGTHLSRNWVERFIGDYDTYNDVVPYNGQDEYYDPQNLGGVYYPEKPLTVNKFPKWVHAMFNNVSWDIDPTRAIGYDSSVGIERKNTTLWRYLMANRTLKYQSNVSSGRNMKSYIVDGEMYLVTNGEAIYKKIDNDPKFPVRLYSGGRELKNGDSWLNLNNFTVELQTRTEANSRNYWVSRTVTDPTGLMEFYVRSVAGNKIRLVDMTPVVGTPKLVRLGSKEFYELNGVVQHSNGMTQGPYEKAITTRYNMLRNVLLQDHLVGYDNSIPKPEEAPYLVTNPGTSAYQGKILHLGVPQQTINPNTDRHFYDTSNNTIRSFRDVQGETVYAFVAIDLDTNLWDISDSGVLVPRKTFPFLQVDNVYFSGINQGVIDSILMEHIGSIKVSELEDGSTLLVGDIEMVKRGDRFVSKPQTPRYLRSLISYADDSSVVKGSILGMFTGMNLSVSGRYSPLIAFIKEPKLERPIEPYAGKVLLAGGEVDTPLVYDYTDNTPKVTPYSRTDIPSVDGIVFSIKLEEFLLARPIDNLNKSYQLMMATNVLSEGYIERIPFFIESLSLSLGEDLSLYGEKTTFKPLRTARQIKENILKEFSQAFRGDIKSLSKLVVISLISFIIVISWITYAILRLGVFNAFLEMLRYPSSNSDREGIDVVKIMTLGLYNMDSNISGAKLVLSNIVLFAILYTIMGVI